MSRTFQTYLNKLYSAKGEPSTHTRIRDDTLSIKGGVYSIKNLKDFYDKYYKHVFVDGKFEFLTEKQNENNGPIAVDFDFRYETSVDERIHNESHINEMIQLYIEEIMNLIIIPDNTEIPIYIFEKEHVNMLDEVTKDGIHMIIGIDMDRKLQIMLRNKILQKIDEVWNDLPLTNTWEDVLDLGITKGEINWQLYGSRKPGNEPYMLVHYYSIKFTEDDYNIYENNIREFNLKEKFPELSVQYKNYTSFEMCDEIKEEFNNFILPSKSKRKNIKLKMTDKKKDMSIFDINNEDMLEECIELFLSKIEEKKEIHLKETHLYTMCLSDNFYNPYDKWIRVGWALKNTHETLFLTWIAFSAKSKKFSFDKISEFYDLWCGWEVNNEDGLSYRSIIYWAKNDNFEEYSIIRKQTIDYYVDKTIDSPTDTDFAVVLYQLYKDEFICVSIKKDIWYIYKNHRWEESEGGTDLRKEISNSLYEIYFEKQRNIVKYLGTGTVDMTSDKAKTLRTKAQQLSEIANSLKRRGNKDNIMREAKEIFYDKKFYEKVDDNPHLLCFNNGVVDFTNNIFRNGKPDDYLSKCTNINYIKLDNKKHKKIIDEINDFMCKLFPEDNLRNYMWEHLASTLIGKSDDQTFNIYNGSGSNGKSKLVELMAKALGDYKGTVPITLITQKRNTIGSTSSEVVALKGTRYAVMQEPSKGDKINEGIMKEITGGDPLQGRALFKDSVTFIPQFKLVVCTNTLLDVGSTDEGTWRRICVCEFKSKFCKKEDFDRARTYQFELDKKLGGKFNDWAPIFISMLVEKAYETGGLVNICDEVKSSSNNYKNTQDFYSEFINDKVKKCTGSKIKETSLYEVFKGWYQLHHGKNIPKGRDLFDYMNKNFGKKIKGVWNNVSIIYDDFDPLLDEYNDD